MPGSRKTEMVAIACDNIHHFTVQGTAWADYKGLKVVLVDGQGMVVEHYML